MKFRKTLTMTGSSLGCKLHSRRNLAVDERETINHRVRKESAETGMLYVMAADDGNLLVYTTARMI